MQKIFIKYVAVIMTAAIFLILFINGLFNSHTMRNQQYKTFQAKIDQMIHTLRITGWSWHCSTKIWTRII